MPCQHQAVNMKKREVPPCQHLGIASSHGQLRCNASSAMQLLVIHRLCLVPGLVGGWVAVVTPASTPTITIACATGWCKPATSATTVGGLHIIEGGIVTTTPSVAVVVAATTLYRFVLLMF